MYEILLQFLAVISYPLTFLILRRFSSIKDLNSLLKSNFLIGFLFSPYYAIYLLVLISLDHICLFLTRKILNSLNK